MTTTPEPKDKLDAMATPAAASAIEGVGMVNGPEDEVFDWAATKWWAVEDDVRRLRQRSFTARQAGTSARQPALGACLSRMHGNVHVRF
jgi:RNA-directed DNA polymerase